MSPARVRLINIFDRSFDNFLATARTCYSAKGIVAPEELAIARDEPLEDAQRKRDRKRSFAQSLFEAGHHTTLQHGHVQFAIEGVSRLFIWSFLHSHPFYNSEQVSQRYVTVEPQSFYVPESLSAPAQKLYLEAIENRIRDYKQLCELLLEPVADEYFSRFTGRQGSKRAELDIRRKAQEIARYVLPLATLAYLYHTVSLITLFRYWRLVNEFDTPTEQRAVVGQMIQQVLEREPEFEAIVQDPLPLELTPEYAFFEERGEGPFFGLPTHWEVDTANANQFVAEFDAELAGKASRLVDFGARNEQVLAEAVREVLGLPRAALSDDDAIALALDPSKNALHGEAMNLAMHSKIGRTLFHAHYTFKKRLSHVADSQDQRHRATPGSRPILMRHYTGRPDYYLPQIVAMRPPARELFERAMEDQWNVMNTLLAGGEKPENVAYLLPNAVYVRFTESADLFGLHHKMAMRLCYNSQEEIWRVCLEEAEQITQIQPRIGRWLLPPCTLRKVAGHAPYCPEGERFCGVAVWRLDRSDYKRTL